ncbi:MAG: hypothetical protein J0H64_03200 [Actinobacteria bacterium]|nr:hypothetical protein [Actinomycetota bacterium]
MSRKKRARVTTPGFTPSANPDQAHWMRELAKSSAAQPHTPQAKKGTRAAQNRRAIRADQQ